MRSMKQNYLMENVINTGYDPAQFAAFMDQKMEGGTNVDNWDFEALMNVVTEFHYSYVDPAQQQNASESKEEDFVDETSSEA